MTTAAAALTAEAAPAANAAEAAPAAANDNTAGNPGAAASAAPGGSQAGSGADPGTVARLDWLGDAPDELHGFAAANGYKGPADVLANVRELQKFLGADKAGRGLVLPKDADDADGWSAVYAKLGRPESAEGYGLDKLEGADPAFAKDAAETFHKLGLSERQASQLAEWWGQTLASQGEAETAEYVAKADEEMAELRAEWGNAADRNEEMARRGAQAFGFSGEELDKIERSIGTKAIMERFLAVGQKLGEDRIPAQRGGSAALSPAGAQERIAELMKDRDFSAKVKAGDGKAKAELEKLYRAAYPG